MRETAGALRYHACVRDPDRFYFLSWSSGDAIHEERDTLPYLIARWLILAFAVWVASAVIGGIHLEGLLTTLAVAAILGLLNLLLKPILFFLTLPITFFTFGLFIIVINAGLLGLTDWIAGLLDLNFQVDNVGSALLGAIVISIISLFLTVFLRPGRLKASS